MKYGNLIDKVLLEMKNSKGKTKLCIKWTGGLDELKDFVSLVLKKPGDWMKVNIKRSLVIFTTAKPDNHLLHQHIYTSVPRK